MSNAWLSEQENRSFIFVMDESDKAWYAKLHRRFVRRELLHFTKYYDLTEAEVKQAYYRVLPGYFVDYKFGRLDPNVNWHLSFYQDVIQEMKNYKKEQIRSRRLIEQKAL